MSRLRFPWNSFQLSPTCCALTEAGNADFQFLKSAALHGEVPLTSTTEVSATLACFPRSGVYRRHRAKTRSKAGEVNSPLRMLTAGGAYVPSFGMYAALQQAFKKSCTPTLWVEVEGDEMLAKRIHRKKMRRMRHPRAHPKRGGQDQERHQAAQSHQFRG